MATNALDYLSKATWTDKIEISKPNLYDFSQISTVKPNALGFIQNIKPTSTPIQPSQIKQPIQQNIQPFVNELEYDIKNGATVQEITTAYPELKWDAKLINELHFDISNWATKEQIQQAYPELSQTQNISWDIKKGWNILQKLSWWVDNLVWWATSQVPKLVWNVWWFFIWKPVDFLLEKAWVDAPSLEKQFKQDWIETKQDFQKFFGTDPESFATEVWEFWTEIWSLFIPWWQAKLISKFPAAADKIRKLSTIIEKASTKAPKTVNLLKSALTWAKEVGKFEAITEWDITPTWLVVWAVANPLIWKTIQWLWKISKAAADKLEVMWLLNPAKLKIVSDQLKTKWVENLSVSEYLLKNKIKWSKEQIIKQLEKLANNSKNKVDKSIAWVKWTFKSEPVDEILTFLRKDLSDVPWQKETINRVSELFTKSSKWEWLTLKEIQEVKRLADKQLGLFTIAWDVRAWATKEWLSKLRWQIQKFIETKADDAWIKNIKQLNKDTQVNRTLIDAITRKDSADQARELLTAFAPWWFGAWVWAFAPAEDPFDRLKNIVIWAWAWQIAWSTKIKTNVASVLDKLSWIQKDSLIKFIESKWATPISSEIIKLIQE